MRLLRRATTSKLVSYLPEEYGAGRSGIGPQTHTVCRHAFMVSSEIVALGFFVLALNVGIGAGNTDVPTGLPHKRRLPTPAE